jgi:hypothetical protein
MVQCLPLPKHNSDRHLGPKHNHHSPRYQAHYHLYITVQAIRSIHGTSPWHLGYPHTTNKDARPSQTSNIRNARPGQTCIGKSVRR